MQQIRAVGTRSGHGSEEWKWVKQLHKREVNKTLLWDMAISLSPGNVQENRSWLLCRICFRLSKCLGSKDSTENSVTAFPYFAFGFLFGVQKGSCSPDKAVLHRIAKTSPTDVEIHKAHSLHRGAELHKGWTIKITPFLSVPSKVFFSCTLWKLGSSWVGLGKKEKIKASKGIMLNYVKSFS